MFGHDGEGVGAGGEDARRERVSPEGEGLKGWGGDGALLVVGAAVVVVIVTVAVTAVDILSVVGVSLLPGDAGVLREEFLAPVVECGDFSPTVEEEDERFLSELGCVVTVLARDGEGRRRCHINGTARLDGCRRAYGPVEQVDGGWNARGDSGHACADLFVAWHVGSRRFGCATKGVHVVDDAVAVHVHVEHVLVERILQTGRPEKMWIISMASSECETSTFGW